MKDQIEDLIETFKKLDKLQKTIFEKNKTLGAISRKFLINYLEKYLNKLKEEEENSKEAKIIDNVKNIFDNIKSRFN